MSMPFGVMESVDDYITDRRVITFDEDKTIEEARKHMDDNETDFLVITKKGKPVYILKKYQTVLKKKDATIASIAAELKPAVVVESGSHWYDVAHRLGEGTVLVVADTKAQKTNFIGTISVYDVELKQRKL